MPVKTFLVWVFSAALCVFSASSALNQMIDAEYAEDRRERRENPQTEPYIRVNQLGFAPSDVKSATVFARETLPEEFRIVAASGAEAFKGKVNQVAGSWGQFDRYGELDFSTLKLEGSYVIEVASARSQKFAISQTVNTLTEFTQKTYISSRMR